MIIIGDRIIDQYIIGTSDRVAPEAPVPIIIPEKEETRLGGAGNVWLNYSALVGNFSTPFIFNHDQKKTIKKRIVANGHIICRIDEEEYTPWEPDFGWIDFSNHKFAVLSDYNKGVLCHSQRIIDTLKEHGIKCLVDPKQPLHYYRDAWLVKLNQKEYEDTINLKFTASSAGIHCKVLCDNNGFKYIIVTLGEKGCFLYEHESNTINLISAAPRNSVDVTGAGDVFMAALAYFVQTESVYEAAKKANTLAGISVEHFGTYLLSPEDVALVKKDKVVFTNGCFDLLHPGHIEMLKQSKALGKKLIVGLNSDASVKRLKGLCRPYYNQNIRKAMLEALGCVDEVIIFDEDTPIELIKKIEPDIITKGGDYTPEQVVGHDLAHVVIIPTVKGHSTTGVINDLSNRI